MAHDSLPYLIPRTFVRSLTIFTSLIAVYLVAVWIYRVFFHPLRKFPGPVIAAISSIPLAYHLTRGTRIFWEIDLHERYDSEVVRVSPNELSFCSANAYREIYSHRKADMPILKKDPVFYRSPLNNIEVVNATETHDHIRMRKAFSHAFSDRALKLQEPLFNVHINKLVAKIREGLAADPTKKFDLCEMFNYTTLDVMADLTFGESMNLLESSEYRPWVEAIFAGFKYSNLLHAIRYFPLLEWFLVTYCIPESVMTQVKMHQENSSQRVDRRIKNNLDRPDIWGLVLSKDGTDAALTREEMYANSDVFMVAGTETTATLLSGLTYYLLTNREKMQKLVAELRSSIPSAEAINGNSLLKLKYLNACIEEGLRIYPPAVEGFPRLTPPGVMTNIDGHLVPPGTKIYVSSLAANVNPRNWHDPKTFLPERFLDVPASESPSSSPFAADKRHGHLPFSSGPRVCLGKNMAYQEVRLIFAKLIYSFDMHLAPESENWLHGQKVYMTWEKTPLYCRFTPVCAS